MMGLTFLVSLAATTALFLLLPSLTRPDLLFAVTVRPELRARAEGQEIVRRYHQRVAAAGAAACALVGAGLATQQPLLLVAGVVVQPSGVCAAFLAARRDVLAHAAQPTTLREAALEPRPRLPGGLAAQASPFVILAGAAAAVAALRDRVPERIAIHYRLDGTPDRFVDATPGVVLGLLAFGALVCAGMLLVAHGISRHSRRVQVSGVAGDGERRFRAAALGVILGAEVLVAVTVALVALVPVVGDPRAPVVFIVVLAPLFGVAVVIVLARLGQGGSRVAGAGDAVIGDRTPDDAWKAGLLYVNRDDPALFVEKRFGIGYTLNFGHPASWLLLVALVTVPILAILLG